MQQVKRYICLILTLVVVFSAMALTVFAAERYAQVNLYYGSVYATSASLSGDSAYAYGANWSSSTKVAAMQLCAYDGATCVFAETIFLDPNETDAISHTNTSGTVKYILELSCETPNNDYVRAEGTLKVTS